MSEQEINWDVEFDSTPDMMPSNPAIEFARKCSGGIGASQISQILTYRPDYSKLPELKATLKRLEQSLIEKGVIEHWENSTSSELIEATLKKASALTDYRNAEKALSQAIAILSDTLPT